MRQTHQAFKVGPGEFNTFNDVLIGVASSAGVSSADTTAVRTVLESTRGDICNTACSGDPVPETIFVLNTQPKSAHPWTDGNTVGFKIDGVEGGGVTLQPGKLYGFQNMAPCAHPLYISLSDQGAGASEVPSGLSYPNGNPFGACNGATLFFTPEASQVGTQLYYQCQVHLRMGGPVTIGSAPSTSVASSSGASSGATSGASSGTPTTGSTTAAEDSSSVIAVPAFFFLAMCLFFLL